MYKAIFCDLDSTLLDKNKEIPSKNIEAIKYAQSKGVKFLVCTGRLPFCIKMFEGQLDLDNAVTSNGCIIYKDGKVVKKEFLDRNDTYKIYEYGIKHNEYERIFTEDFLYLMHIEKGGEDAHFFKDSKGVSEEETYSLINNENIVKMSFYGDHEHLLDIKKDLETMNLNINITFSSHKLLECIKKGQSKALGMKEFCALSNIDIKDTIGIGDGDNDHDMLMEAGIGTCPSNSEPEIKEICDYIAINDNNNAAVAEIIKKYVK